MHDILDSLKRHNIRAAFVPNLHEFFVHKVKINQVGRIPLVQEEDDVQMPYLYIKRYFDLILALIVIMLSWPPFLM